MTLDPSTAATGRRFRFVTEGAAVGVIRHHFGQPRKMAVIEEAVQANALLSETSTQESSDHLDIILVSAKDTVKFSERTQIWLAGDHEERSIITVTTEAGKIRFAGRRALVQASIDHVEDLIGAVIEFGFLDSELRRLEEALLPIQSGAPDDVAFAYRIRQSDQKQWDRLCGTMEQLALLRLTFARLEPLMGCATPSLPLEARRAMCRLLGKTNTADRLEAFSDRLEACEDLYEGAVDRITDYRWYRRGNLLEIAIVVLLAAEAGLLLLEHFRH